MGKGFGHHRPPCHLSWGQIPAHSQPFPARNSCRERGDVAGNPVCSADMLSKTHCLGTRGDTNTSPGFPQNAGGPVSQGKLVAPCWSSFSTLSLVQCHSRCGDTEGSHGERCRAPETSAEISLQGCLKSPDSDAATHHAVGEATGASHLLRH